MHAQGVNANNQTSPSHHPCNHDLKARSPGGETPHGLYRYEAGLFVRMGEVCKPRQPTSSPKESRSDDMKYLSNILEYLSNILERYA